MPGPALMRLLLRTPRPPPEPPACPGLLLEADAAEKDGASSGIDTSLDEFLFAAGAISEAAEAEDCSRYKASLSLSLMSPSSLDKEMELELRARTTLEMPS